MHRVIYFLPAILQAIATLIPGRDRTCCKAREWVMAMYRNWILAVISSGLKLLSIQPLMLTSLLTPGALMWMQTKTYSSRVIFSELLILIPDQIHTSSQAVITTG